MHQTIINVLNARLVLYHKEIRLYNVILILHFLKIALQHQVRLTVTHAKRDISQIHSLQFKIVI